MLKLLCCWAWGRNRATTELRRLVGQRLRKMEALVGVQSLVLTSRVYEKVEEMAKLLADKEKLTPSKLRDVVGVDDAHFEEEMAELRLKLDQVEDAVWKAAGEVRADVRQIRELLERLELPSLKALLMPLSFTAELSEYAERFVHGTREWVFADLE